MPKFRFRKKRKLPRRAWARRDTFSAHRIRQRLRAQKQQSSPRVWKRQKPGPEQVISEIELVRRFVCLVTGSEFSQKDARKSIRRMISIGFLSKSGRGGYKSHPLQWLLIVFPVSNWSALATNGPENDASFSRPSCLFPVIGFGCLFWF